MDFAQVGSELSKTMISLKTLKKALIAVFSDFQAYVPGFGCKSQLSLILSEIIVFDDLNHFSLGSPISLKNTPPFALTHILELGRDERSW